MKTPDQILTKRSRTREPTMRKILDDIDSSSGTLRRTRLEMMEEGNKQMDPDAASFRTYLSSDVDYVHAPDTTPPIPSFPLDETSVIIGG